MKVRSKVSRIWITFGVFLVVRLWSQSSGVEAVMEALEHKRYHDALRLLAPLVRAAPQDVRLRTLEGIALSGVGRKPDALRSYRAALKVAPSYLPALQGAAEIEFQLRDPAAKTTLQAVLRRQPSNQTAHAMLGVLAYEQEDCPAAVRHFQAAGRESHNNPAAQWRYGHCLLALGRAQEAVEIFERLRALRPDDAALRYNLALARYQTGQAQQAAAMLEPLTESHAPDSDVLSLAAAAFEAAGETPRAVQLLQRAIRLYPAEERHYVDLAVVCMNHDEPNLALEILGVGLRHNPKSSRLYAMRGVVHGELSRFAEAEADFERASQLEPEKGFGPLGLSVVLQRTGRDEEALRKLRDHLRREPQDAAANWMLAQTLVRTGAGPGTKDFEDAREALVRALAGDPKLVPARTLLGKLYLQAGDSSRAVQELQRAVELDPGDRTAVYQLMVALREAGRQAEIPALLSRVRELIQKNAAEEQKNRRYRIVKAPPESR
ncbi:MAG: tetratricopeptide repeat protein [Bryobacterales bacterium]|nr:tetratricopeptide repeat protein [Bryobacterales bacterium]